MKPPKKQNFKVKVSEMTNKLMQFMNSSLDQIAARPRYTSQELTTSCQRWQHHSRDSLLRCCCASPTPRWSTWSRRGGLSSLCPGTSTSPSHYSQRILSIAPAGVINQMKKPWTEWFHFIGFQSSCSSKFIFKYFWKRNKCEYFL